MNKMEKRLVVIAMCVALSVGGIWGIANAASDNDTDANANAQVTQASDYTYDGIVADSTTVSVTPDSYASEGSQTDIYSYTEETVEADSVVAFLEADSEGNPDDHTGDDQPDSSSERGNSTDVPAQTNTIDLSNCVIDPIPDQRYTGSSISVPVTVTYTASLDSDPYVLEEGTDYTVSFSVDKNAKTATATITGINSTEEVPAGQPVFVGEQTVTFYAEYTPVLENTGLIYNGTDQKLVTVDDELEGKLQFSLDNWTTPLDTIPMGNNAKTYNIKYRAKDSTVSITEGSVSVTIDPFKTSISVNAISDRIDYDGKFHNLVAFKSVPAIPSTIIRDFGYSPISDIQKKEPGVYSVNITETMVNKFSFKNITENGTKDDVIAKFVVGDSPSGNYEIVGSQTDNKKMTVKITNADGVYGDGKEHQISVSVSGPETGKYTIYYKIGANGTYSTTNPSFKGKDADNYRVYVKVEADGYETFETTAMNYGSVFIDPKPLTISWETTNLTYTGKEQAPIVTMSGKLPGDSLSYIIKGKESEVGGPYTAYLELTGDDADNYEIPEGKGEIDFYIKKSSSSSSSDSEESGSSTVTLKNMDVDIESTLEYTYDGKTHEPQISVNESSQLYVKAYSESANGTFSSVIPKKYSEVSADGKPQKLYVKVSDMSKPKEYNDYLGYCNVIVKPREVVLDWTPTGDVIDEGVLPAATASNLIDGDVCNVIVNTTSRLNKLIATATSLDNKNYVLSDVNSKTYTLTGSEISLHDCTVDIVSPESLIYSGSPIEPEVKVTYETGGSKLQLEKGRDFLVSYKDNINAGTNSATVVIVAKETDSYKSGDHIFIDSVEKAYTIIQREATLSWFPIGETITNDGINDVTVSNLADGDTCDVAFSTQKNSDSVVVRVTGLSNGNYRLPSTVTKTYSVYNPEVSLSDCEVKLNSSETFIYDGTEKKPEVTVSYGTGSDKVVLTKDKDYTVSYKNNTNAGTASVIVTGKGKTGSSGNTNDHIYVDSKEIEFSIGKRVAAISWNPEGDTIANGVRPTATVANLIVGDSCVINYSVSATQGSNTIQAEAYGISNNNYVLPAQKTKTYTVLSSDYISISDCDIQFTSTDLITYTGLAIEPEVVVTYGTGDKKVTLVKDKDYTVAYSNNVNVGNNTATVTVTGKGDATKPYQEGDCKYTGSVDKKFTISKPVFKPVANDLTFNNTEQQLVSLDSSVSDKLSGKVLYCLENDKSKAVSDITKITAKNAGDYNVYYWLDSSITSIDNYEMPSATGEFVTVTIKKLPVTLTISGNTGTAAYDGKEHSVTGFNRNKIGYRASVTYKNSGYNTDNIVYKDGATPTATGTEVGKYYMGLKAEDFSYNDPNFNVTFVIRVTDGVTEDGYIEITSKKKEMIVKITNADGVYGDGKEHQISVSVSGPESGKYTIYYKVGANGTYSTTNPSFKGKDSDNYRVYVKVEADGYETFETTDKNYGCVFIDPKPLTITWGSTTLTYTGKEQAPTVSMSGKISGDSLSYTIDGKESEVGGPYTAYLELTGDDADNYEIPEGKDEIDFYIKKATSNGSGTGTGANNGSSAGLGNNSKGASSNATSGSKNGSTSPSTGSKTGSTTTGSKTTSTTGSSSSSKSSSSTSDYDTTDSLTTGSLDSLGTLGDDPLGLGTTSTDYDETDDLLGKDDNEAEYESAEEEEDEDGDDDWEDDWDEDSYEVDSDEYDTEGMMTYGRSVHLADPDHYPVIIAISIIAVILSLIAGVVFLIVANVKPKSTL